MQKAMKEKALDKDSGDAGHAATVARDTGEALAASAAPNGSSYANGEAFSKTPSYQWACLRTPLTFLLLVISKSRILAHLPG